MSDFAIKLAKAVAIGLTSVQTAKIWKRLYIRGKAIGLPMTLISASLWSYLAYHTPDPHTSRLYTICAAIIPTFVPYTLIMMKSTDEGLIRAATDDKVDPTYVKKLFEKWYKLHIGRALILAISSVVGIWAVVSRT
ncbi:hypothetical protein QFC20_002205 [Naganishia adeliensis]|uniref:Uncharacterized protein n=1 Tax=Naganishia adeliensis TaxID=92952 RepID=A0ACC2WLB4_9TREE|nr:hypothetical protein QFC20_002205 [Naganishia adeliensis]